MGACLRQSTDRLRPYQILSDHKPTDLATQQAAQGGVNPGAPSIIIRTKASVTSQDARDDSDEIGTVAMATRITRSPSVSSFASTCILRPLSSTSVEENANRSRSSTLGSITSEGFRNMIQSNRNSWTGSELGNESIPAMLERQGALAEAITSPSHTRTHALQVRDSNMSSEKASNDYEEEKIAAMGTPTMATPASALQASPMRRGSLAPPQRLQVVDVQQLPSAALSDENMAPALTNNTSRVVPPTHRIPSTQGRPPRLISQKSILSLR